MLENYKVLRSNYIKGNGTFLTLRTAEGEPYADITINIPPYTSDNVIALSHNFTDFCDSKLVSEFIETYTEKYMFSVESGFVKFDLYKLKDNILNSIEEL